MAPSIGRLSGEQNHRCCYCGVRMKLGHAKATSEEMVYVAFCHPRARAMFDYWRTATRDHIIPASAGGGYTYENLVAACMWCNSYRGNLPADEALKRIQRLVARGSHPHTRFNRSGYFDLTVVRPPVRQYANA